MKSEKRVSDVLGICRLPGAVPFSPKLLLIFEQADALPDPSQYPVPAHLWQEVCPSTQEEGGEDGKEEEKGRERVRGMNLIKNRCLHTCDSVFQIKKKMEDRAWTCTHSLFPRWPQRATAVQMKSSLLSMTFTHFLTHGATTADFPATVLLRLGQAAGQQGRHHLTEKSVSHNFAFGLLHPHSALCETHSNLKSAEVKVGADTGYRVLFLLVCWQMSHKQEVISAHTLLSTRLQAY